MYARKQQIASIWKRVQLENQSGEECSFACSWVCSYNW
jgi:hypothetical protein